MSAVRSGIAITCGLMAALLCLQGTTLAQSAPHDMRFIADKPLVAIWSHPNEHLANPVLAELVKALQDVAPPDAQAVIGTAIPKMDLMRVSMSMGKNAYSDQPRPIGVSLFHFTDPAAATVLLNNMSKGLETKTAPEFKSPVYYRKPWSAPGEAEKDWKLGMGVTQLNPQTVVNSESVEKMLQVLTPAAATTPPAWSNDLATLAKTQSTMFIDLVQVRDEMKQAGPPPGQGGMEGMIFNSVKSLWEQADYAFVSLDTTNGIQLSAQAQSPNAESAQRFKGALDGILGLAKGFLPTAKQAAQQLNQMQPGLGEMAYTELENLVSSIKITQTGTQTKLTLGIPQETLAKVPALILPAIKQARERAMAMQSTNNMKQIALAMHNYHDTHRGFPAAVMLGKDGKTPHSWRVAILPYIEEQALYNQYKFDEPWDSENNKKVAATIPAGYRSVNATNGATSTSYVVLTHPDGVFNATPAAKGSGIQQITDGTSNTIMVVEANTEIPWTKPEDLPLVDGQPLPALGFPGATTFNVAMCDGSVQRLTTKLTDEFRKLVTKGDGNVVDVEALRPQDGGAPGQPQPPRSGSFESSTKSPASVPATKAPASAPADLAPRRVPPPAAPVPVPAPPGIPAPPQGIAPPPPAIPAPPRVEP